MQKDPNSKEVSVLFVCLGNICRSPTSEGVFRAQATRELADFKVYVDSAGTASYHAGYPPDRRAIRAASRRGIDISSSRARRVSLVDFDVFDYIIAMDYQNYEDLRSLTPANYQGHVGLFMDYASGSPEREVPDPYYGGVHGFDRVLDMIEDASAGLIEKIQHSYSNR